MNVMKVTTGVSNVADQSRYIGVLIKWSVEVFDAIIAALSVLLLLLMAIRDNDGTVQTLICEGSGSSVDRAAT